MQTTTIDRIAAVPAVRTAAESAAALIALWPLSSAMQMDNDAKYAEELQVRVTRAFATVMTGQDVTVPDAEFVYEGADEIPGRPQEIVDALLAANDAYDTMVEFGQTGDVESLFESARLLDAGWDESTCSAVGDAIADAESALEGLRDDAANVDAIARRFAVALLTCHELVRVACGVGEEAGADAVDAVARRVLPVLLLVNELRERHEIPRICLTAAQIRELVGLRDSAEEATAEFVAPLAAAEWTKHREDVLWDPDEAKKRAKEEDEKRNKEALAAKFAHVKDDPNKPHVEL